MLAHPLRVRILEVLNQQDMSPVEFCRDGFAPEGIELSQIAYHFRELAEYGALAALERNPRRGSVEHVYRGLGRAYFSDLQWNELDHEERVRLSKTMVQGLMARIEGALLSDTFDSCVNRHLTWIAMRLDEQGWTEMTTALAATFGESNRSGPTRKRASIATGRTASRPPAGSSASPRRSARSSHRRRRTSRVGSVE